MRFTYDNSTNNIRNPHNPPVRVQYGLQTTDEMAGLIFQLLAGSQADLNAFQLSNQKNALKEVLEFNTLMLQRDPDNAHAHVQLAKALLIQGKQQEAFGHLQRAVQIDPNESEGHYHLGLIAMDRDQAAPAISEFEKAIAINPDYVKARNNLGLVFMALGRYPEAERQFRAALATAPEDQIVAGNLRLLDQTRAAKKR
jgi:tetratricopeptide (TPR) repeat protein